MADGVRLRPAAATDVDAIANLNNLYATQALMLQRTPAEIALVIDDYMVAVDGHDTVLGCGALKEYSPSVAEVAGIAVAPALRGNGVGKRVVEAVERLAMKRGIYDVFALTLQPEFFSAIGYARVDRARYPEKIRRDCLACSRRFACNETCFAKNLRAQALAA